MADHAEPVRKPRQAGPAAPAAVGSDIGAAGDPVFAERRRMLDARPAAAGAEAAARLSDRPAGPQPVQRRSVEARPVPAVRGGLPGPLKAGIETLSGITMDDVRVHYGSAAPAALGAAAYAQGNHIHIGPGQERHLAHEAWNVVQQKQGRVKAGAQLKGMAVNADPRPESEADRMGDAAALRPSAPAIQPLGRTGGGAPVLQARLRYMNTTFTDASFVHDPLPARMQPYHVSPVVYEIRDDWNADFSSTIHLLPHNQKYLLGEIHDASHWAADVEHWPTIPKMLESDKAIPELPEAVDPQEQKLESMHAYLMHITLGAHGAINLIRAGAAARPALADVDELLLDLGQMANAQNIYLDAEDDIDAHDPAHALLGAFITACADTYAAATLALNAKAQQIKTEVERNVAGAPGAVQNFQTLKNELVALAAFIPALVRGLRGLAGIAAAGALGTRIETEVTSQAHVPLAQSAAMAVREAAMARNVNGAAAPLLVKVGDGHVVNLGKLVDDAVEVRHAKRLSSLTRVR